MSFSSKTIGRGRLVFRPGFWAGMWFTLKKMLYKNLQPEEDADPQLP